MEKPNPEFEHLLARQASHRREARRSLEGASRCHLERYRQDTRQVPPRTQVSDHIREFYSSFCSSNYEEIIRESRKICETPSKNHDGSTIYGPLKEFSNDFTSLMNNPVFSDVEIKCGDEVIKAHKNILTSRSKVFDAMFSISMVENATGVVMIDDLDPQVVRDLLAFIYSNKVQNMSLIKACGLLEASTKYHIQTLKDICVDFLITMLTSEHSLLILQKADLYDEKLKRFAIHFIKEKFFDLRVTEEWIAMQSRNPVLALEVCNVVIDKLAEKH